MGGKEGKETPSEREQEGETLLLLGPSLSPTALGTGAHQTRHFISSPTMLLPKGSLRL